MFAALVACSGLALADTPKPTPRPAPPISAIPIGAYLSLTGASASFGRSTREGIEVALGEYNAKATRKLQLQVVDTAGKPADAEAAVNQLADAGVVAVIGEVASSLSLAGGVVAQKRGVPMLTPSSTHAGITQIGDMITRLCVVDAEQAKAAAKFARDNLKLGKVALLVDKTATYSMNLADQFKREFEMRGGNVVAKETYSGGHADFKSQLAAIAATKADAIYIPGFYTDVAEIAKQARAANIKVPLIGGDGWDSPQLYTLAGAAIEHSYFTNHFALADQRPVVKSFVAAFRTKFKQPPDALAALAYDATHVLAAALDRAKTHNGADIAAAIRTTTNHEGVTGTITIDPKTGEPKKSVFVLQVTSTTTKLAATIR
jgi:branched-chain amino acid transport system substrate-binding protein